MAGRWIGGVAALGSALSLAYAVPAPGAPEPAGARCTLTAATHRLEIVIERDPTYISGTKDGSVTLYPRLGTIEVEAGDGSHPVVCAGGVPTTTNVDSISITKHANVRNASVILVEGGGAERFAPGATAEPDASSEIEIEVDLGSSGGAFIVVGSGRDRVDFGGLAGEPGANLNAEEAVDDPDLRVVDGFLGIHAGAGKDVLRASGVLAGFTGPFPEYRGRGPALFGDGGADRLVGSAAGDSLIGGTGRDRIRAGDGSDYVGAEDGTRDIVHCGRADRDRAELDRIDERRSCELPPASVGG